MQAKMSLIPLVNPLLTTKHSKTLIRPHLLSNRIPNSKFSFDGSKKPAIPFYRREISRVWCSNPIERSEETGSEEVSETQELSFLMTWDVPWDWKITACVMMPYLMSIVLTGVVESMGLAGALQPYSENMLSQLQSTDELAIRMFMDQLLKSVVKLSILYIFVSPYQPLPDDIFSLRWERPFNIQNGWILWAAGGLIVASCAVLLGQAFISSSSASQIQNEAEPLVRLLPLIGSSNISTVCLLSMLGILAPICEETIYRGFLMTSLTKWFPLPLSLVLSSAVFTLAHHSPGKSIEIFIFGMVLGLIYAQTRNLLTPITMHACWNVGVILLLTFLQSQGHEIQKYVL